LALCNSLFSLDVRITHFKNKLYYFSEFKKNMIPGEKYSILSKSKRKTQNEPYNKKHILIISIKIYFSQILFIRFTIALNYNFL